jgi:hypothetical protein
MELENKDILNAVREGILTDQEENSIIKAAGITAAKYIK